MRRKLSAGLVLAIVLALVAIGALAAVLLGGKAFVTEIMKPKAMENNSDTWTQAEVEELLDRAAAHGLELDAEKRARLLEGGGYYKEELMRIFAKEELGFYPSTWSLEDQAWYDQLLVDSGLSDERVRFLPEGGEATQEQVLEAVETRIRTQYQPDAPLSDPAIYRRHLVYQWMGDADEDREKGWNVWYEPLDLVHTGYDFILDTGANIVQERVTPGLMSGETSPPPLRELRNRYEEVYGNYADWEMETWVSFREALLASGAAHGWGQETVLELLSLSEFALPAEGTLPKAQAMDAALEAAVAAGGEAENLRPASAYATYLMDGETPVWKVVLPGKAEGNTLVELDARTGEARKVAFAPYGSSLARYFLLDSVYLAHAKEQPEAAGTLRFENRTYEAVEPMPDGGFLLAGSALAYGEDGLLYPEACATRLGPGGETLWEALWAPGNGFQEAVALDDGRILLAYEPKGGEMLELALVTLDGEGKAFSEPVPLGLSGWAEKGDGYLLVDVFPEGEGSQPRRYVAVDEKGGTLWAQTYDQLPGSGFSPLAVEGGYLVAGSVSRGQQLEETFGLAGKLDATGNLLWSARTTEEPGTVIRAFCGTPDGGLLGTGSHSLRREEDGSEYGKTLNFAVRFGPAGEVLWFRDYPQPDIDTGGGSLLFDQMLPTAGGGALILGNVPRTQGCYLFEVDGAGEVLRRWQPEMGGQRTGTVRMFAAGERAWLLSFHREESDQRYAPTVTYVTPVQ